MRITACKDRCLQGSLSLKIAEGKTVTAAIVGVQENKETMCVSTCVVTLGSVWEKPWVHVLPCSVWMGIRYMDAARR